MTALASPSAAVLQAKARTAAQDFETVFLNSMFANISPVLTAKDRLGAVPGLAWGARS